jgi:hypothetical protein
VSKGTSKPLKVASADRLNCPLALNLHDRGLKTERIAVGNDVNTAVTCRSRSFCPVAHGDEKPGDEVLEAKWIHD